MRRSLWAFALLAGTFFMLRQTTAAILTENFDEPGGFFGTTGTGGNLPSVPSVSDWVVVNRSTAGGTSSWYSGSAASPFLPQSGSGFAAVDLNSVPGDSTDDVISNWLITPQLSFNAGDVVTFYTRTLSPVVRPDRLQVRMSLSGASTNVGGTSTTVGDFTSLLLDINPNLVPSGYPVGWTLQSITIPSSGSGRLGFHYFVNPGGALTQSGNIIGIDSVSIVPEPMTLGTIAIALLTFVAPARRGRRGMTCGDC